MSLRPPLIKGYSMPGDPPHSYNTGAGHIETVTIKPFDIVQVSPEWAQEEEGRQAWAGVLVIVSEVKTFGIQGYTPVPLKLDEPAGLIPIRLEWGAFTKVGEAVWTTK